MKHNVYANGNVQNIGFTDSDSDKSVGVVKPGTYKFTTEREEMENGGVAFSLKDWVQRKPEDHTEVEK